MASQLRRQINPLWGMEIREVPVISRRDHVRIMREAIERAHQEAATNCEIRGGRRHMRAPLTEEEVAYHSRFVPRGVR